MFRPATLIHGLKRAPRKLITTTLNQSTFAPAHPVPLRTPPRSTSSVSIMTSILSADKYLQNPVLGTAVKHTCTINVHPSTRAPPSTGTAYTSQNNGFLQTGNGGQSTQTARCHTYHELRRSYNAIYNIMFL